VAGSHATAGAFSVASVKPFDDVHAFDDLAEGRKASFDVVAGGVIAKVDVNLGGPGVWAGVGEGDVASGVVLFQRVVEDGDAALVLRDGGVAIDPDCTQRPGTTRKKRESS
jgi:hypothetical protein